MNERFAYRVRSSPQDREHDGGLATLCAILREARARMLELKALAQEGRLYDVEEMTAFVTEALGGAKAKVGAVPARYCERSDVAGRRRLEDMLDQAFAEAAAVLDPGVKGGEAA